MLRRDRLIRMQVHELMDACLFALSFWLACMLREDADLSDFLGLTKVGLGEDQYVWLLFLVLIPAAPMVLEAQGFYNRPLSCARRTTAWVLLKASCIIALALIIATYCFQIQMRRGIIVWFGVVSFALMLIKEEVLRRVTRSRIAQSQNRRRFILVGTDEETRAMRAELKAKSPEAIEVLAELDLSKTPIERLVEMLHDYSVNGVIVSAKHTYFEQAEEVIRACEVEGVEAWVVADFFRTTISRTTLDDFYGRPVMVFRTAPESSWQGLFKQLIDFFGALILLLLSSPFLLIVALLVKRSSPGPVLFRQKRSGLNGCPFTILKFRTMVSNAEQLKHELAAMNEMSGPVFKVTNDPRVTPIGRWLRKKSLDELPQLFNVLRGDMSLVGPRPLPVDEVKRFNDLAHRRRLSVKPGLTCLWQISGRNNVSNFDDWVQLDLKYIDTWSLWLDFKILARTVPVVLTGTGAK